MTTKRLRAVFATDRDDYLKTLAIADAIRVGAPVRLNFGATKNLLGEPLVGCEGPAQDVMHLIGAVANEGEDFLVSVLPC